MKYIFALFFSSFIFIFGYSQKSEYATFQINDSLKQNANAIVRLDKIDIIIFSQREMEINTKRVVTVLNEKGLEAINATEYYNKLTSITSIDATVYDAFGLEVKKIKRKDFKDQCIIDGITILSDQRFMYLKYTPISYPFTIVYESTITTSTTAFIPSWSPISDYNVSIEKSILNVTFPNNLGFRKKESNLSDFKVIKNTETATQLSYTVSKIRAQKPEEMSVSVYKIFPIVNFGLDTFNLEGIDGNAKTWKEFGQWYSTTLLKGTEELPEETKLKIKNLVGAETDNIKKAKIIYKYVQEKVRYVSIQIGIGGFKPMLAKDVDRLGYGDCKALSNYTKALLDVVNVPSYVTLLYGGRKKRDIKSDFVSMQGNHMILCIPNNGKNIFLECTSQIDPFGYQGVFTDDRDVLIIKPDEGEIVKTKIYTDENNIQYTKGKFGLTEKGDWLATLTISTQGSLYSKSEQLETKSTTDKEAHYKERFDNISNLEIVKNEFENNKETIVFKQNLELNAQNYAKTIGANFIFPINAFNQFNSNIKRIRDRKTPFEIERGYNDMDEIEVTLPEGFAIESIPQKFELSSKFGNYKTEVIQQKDNLVYKRNLFLKSGTYLNSEYEEFRLFTEQISKNDNAKVVLIKK
jgi:hypothetical protein